MERPEDHDVVALQNRAFDLERRLEKELKRPVQVVPLDTARDR